MDVARKKALRQNPVLETAFAVRACVALVLSIVVVSRVILGYGLTIHNAHVEFAAVLSVHLPPALLFLAYLLLDTGLVTVSVVLYFRALQVSPMSLCVPFLAFTPAFLLVTGYLFLGERTTLLQMVGTLFIVFGSLIMHRDLFRRGALEPVRALFREEGSRYMLIVSFILSITNPIDKRLVEMSDPFFQSWTYAVMLVIFIGVFTLTRHSRGVSITRSSWGWIAVAGLLDATALLLQFISHKYIQVVVTISIKRAGIVLAVFCGWLFFHEQQVPDRLIAASVMLAGALMLYLPLSGLEAILFPLAVFLTAGVTLLVTRNPPIEKQAP